MSDRQRCAATVYVRDTYRRTGRGKTGFEMHYTKRQCKRKAGVGQFCHQHAPYGEAVRTLGEQRNDSTESKDA